MSMPPHVPDRRLPRELRERLVEVRDEYMRRLALRRWSLFGLYVLVVTVAVSAVVATAGAELPLWLVWTIFAALITGGLYGIVVRSLRRPPSLQQIAHFIDEHHPELENRLLSAVEFGERSGAATEPASAWMIRRVLEETDALAARARWGGFTKPSDAARSVAVAAIALLASLGVIGGFHDLWLPDDLWRSVRLGAGPGANDLRVKPGDARVRLGENQAIVLETDDAGREATIAWRSEGVDWRQAPMRPGPGGKVFYHTFEAVDRDLDYRVRYGRRESHEYRLTLWQPPEVRAVDLVYHYPDYLKLESREAPNSGDISAVRGTVVDVEVRANKPVQQAALVLGAGGRKEMDRITPQIWRTRLTLSEDDKYQIELRDEEGETNPYPETWEVAVARDEPPRIEVEFPRGDRQVTALDEVPLEFSIADDYGLAEFGVEYRLAGREPIRETLQQLEPGERQAEGALTLTLEEHDLAAGDLVSWSVWARDYKPDRNQFEELGDVFFLEVRPFRQEYREAVSNQGAGMGMQGPQQDPARIQKEIIIATWNLRRDLAALSEAEYADRLQSISIAQAELVQTVRRNSGGAMGAGGGEGSQREMLTKLMDEMMRALRALRDATGARKLEKLSEAAAHEQNAYEFLLKMRPDQVDVQQMMMDGAAGASMPRPEMSDLELDRNRNFYEEERRTDPRREEQAAAETLDKLRDLAARQEMVNEETNRLVSEMQNADEARREELRRRLENLRRQQQQAIEQLDRLQREMASSEMSAELAGATEQALQQAREHMSETLEKLEQEGLQEARSSGARAEAALQQSEERLAESARSTAEGEVRELSRRMRDLAEAEAAVHERVSELRRQFESPGMQMPEGFEGGQERLAQEKERLGERFSELMNEAGELAQSSRAGQPLMSRKLGDWLRRTSADGITESMEEGRKLIDYGIWSAAEAHEAETLEKLEDAARRLESVAQAAVGDETEALERALEELERIAGPLRGQGEQRDVAMAGDGQEGEQQGSRAGEGEEGREGTEEGEAAGGEAGRETDKGSDEAGAREGTEGISRTEMNEGTDGSGAREAERGEETGEASERAEHRGQSNEEMSGGGERDGERAASGEQSGERAEGDEENGGRAASGVQDGGTVGAAEQIGGGRAPLTPPPAPMDLRRFFEQDYGEWVEAIRNAQSLVPQDRREQAQLEMIRRELEGMRREFRRHSQPPRYELFLETVGNPLLEVTDALAEEIARSRRSERFILTDPGQVPHRYREQVARYFESLAEMDSATGGAEAAEENPDETSENVGAGGRR